MHQSFERGCGGLVEAVVRRGARRPVRTTFVLLEGGFESPGLRGRFLLLVPAAPAHRTVEQGASCWIRGSMKMFTRMLGARADCSEKSFRFDLAVSEDMHGAFFSR